MKRILYALVCLFFLSTTISAQSATEATAEKSKVEKKDSVRNIKEYVGTYLFEADGEEEEAVIAIINDSILHISAYIGEAYIKRDKNDKFILTQYEGTIEFTADKSNKIKGIIATINEAGIYKLEARKKEEKK